MDRSLLASLLLPAALAACASSAPPPGPPGPVAGDGDSSGVTQYASTYARRPFQPVLIRNATILTAAGPEAQGSILFAEGKIVAIGQEIAPPADALIIDGTGKFVTPGLIDPHVHLREPGRFLN